MAALFEIVYKPDYTIAKFNICIKEISKWRDIVINLPYPEWPQKVHYFNIEISEDDSYASVNLFSSYKVCLQLVKIFQKSLDNRELELDSEEKYVGNKIFEDCVNSDSDFFEYSDFSNENCRGDTWMDYGYMNDITNLFEVY